MTADAAALDSEPRPPETAAQIQQYRFTPDTGLPEDISELDLYGSHGIVIGGKIRTDLQTGPDQTGGPSKRPRIV